MENINDLLLQNYSFKYSESKNKADAIIISCPDLSINDKEKGKWLSEISLMCDYTEYMCHLFNTGVLLSGHSQNYFDGIFRDVFKLHNQHIKEKIKEIFKHDSAIDEYYCEMRKYGKGLESRDKIMQTMHEHEIK